MLGYETRRVREARIPVSHFSRVERRRATLENVIFRRNRRRVYARARARTFHARWPYLILRQVRPAYWFVRGLPFHSRISCFSARYSLLRIYRRGWVRGYSRNSEQGFRSDFVEFVVRDDATFFASYPIRKITNATRPRASPLASTSIGGYVSSIRPANPMESRDAGVQVRVSLASSRLATRRGGRSITLCLAARNNSRLVAKDIYYDHLSWLEYATKRFAT